MTGLTVTSPNTLPDLSEHANTTSKWFRGDNEERYNRNISEGVIPPYGPDDITYVFNIDGFRGEELKYPSNKMALYGCSLMMGYGLPDDLSVPSLVGGYNLGIAGASNDLIARTLISTVPIIEPKSVFVYWTYTTRREIFTATGQPINWIRNWQLQTVEPKEEHIPYMHAQEIQSNRASNINNLLKNIALVDLFLKSRAVTYNWSMVIDSPMKDPAFNAAIEPYMANYIKAPLGDIMTDCSRDLTHLGPISSRTLADKILAV
jgi:hypothetical protein